MQRSKKDSSESQKTTSTSRKRSDTTQLQQSQTGGSRSTPVNGYVGGETPGSDDEDQIQARSLARVESSRVEATSSQLRATQSAEEFESGEEMVEPRRRARVESALPAEWSDVSRRESFRSGHVQQMMSALRDETAVVDLEVGVEPETDDDDGDDVVQPTRRGGQERPTDDGPRQDGGPGGRGGGPYGLDEPDSGDPRRNARDRDGRQDEDGYVSVPVTSSANFDDRDEDYLSRLGAKQSRPSAVMKRPTRQEEAKGLGEIQSLSLSRSFLT